MLIAAGLEAWVAVYTAYAAPSVVRQFRDLFASFGDELPGVTKAVLAQPHGARMFALWAVGQLVWIAARSRPSAVERRWMKIAAWVFGGVFGIVIAWAIYGLYLPVFRLGSVI